MITGKINQVASLMMPGRMSHPKLAGGQHVQAVVRFKRRMLAWAFATTA